MDSTIWDTNRTPPSGIRTDGVVDLYQIKAYHQKKRHNVTLFQFYINGVQLSDVQETGPFQVGHLESATTGSLCWHRGSDGKEDHMVCLANVWVFDFNCATMKDKAKERRCNAKTIINI